MAELLKEIFGISNQLQSLLLEFAMKIKDHQIDDQPKPTLDVVPSPLEVVAQKPVAEEQVQQEEEKQPVEVQTKKQIKQGKTQRQVQQVQITLSDEDEPEKLQIEPHKSPIKEPQNEVVPEAKQSTEAVPDASAKPAGIKFPCTHCGKIYESRGGLSNHVKKFHKK